jgi:hypothetical protein
LASVDLSLEQLTEQLSLLVADSRWLDRRQFIGANATVAPVHARFLTERIQAGKIQFIYFLRFSADKSHVNPQNHLTH